MSELSTELSSLWNYVTGEAEKDWQLILGFLKNFWKVVVPAEISALAPIAEKALADLGISVSNSSTLSEIATAAGQVLSATASKAEEAGLQAAGSALIIAVGGAIANAQAAEVSPAPVATPVTPAN